MTDPIASELDRAVVFERLAAQAPMAGAELVVLCASRRLAQHLQDAYARWQLARGVLAWASPALQTAETFLDRLGEQLALQRLASGGAAEAAALGPAEVELLWRLVVAETRTDAQGLLRETEAAQLAGEAWRLCRDHGIELPLPATTPDVERFNHWAQAYRARCARLQRVDPADARRRVIAALAAGALPAPATVVLAGFDGAAPWLRGLWAALQHAGSALMRLRDVTVPDAQVRACVAAGGEQELRAAAQWVRRRALAQPQARIGVIVPDLGARRADVLRVFDQTLCASLDALPAGRGERPYNVSLGESLVQLGAVHCALALLRLCVEGLELADAGSLLCAPYWGAGESERLARAEIDRVLRAQWHRRVDLPLLRRLAWRDEALQRGLQRLLELRSVRGGADPGEWAERFAAWLDAAGWPGPRVLDSAEYQAIQAWRELLRELGSLGGVSGPVAASGALAQLQLLATQRVFQPQTPSVNIHVLGALEAQGLDFDALWVMGLDDERWPPAGRPNPFIPFELQRRFNLPHAAAAQELVWAEGMTRRWRQAAAEVVFSWPAASADRPLAPSPLIRLEAAAAEGLTVDALSAGWRAAAAQGREERLADHDAPPPDADRPVPGGARLLGDQARCPFRAFATHRLGAQALEQPGYGLSYIDRGQLVHRALEVLWRDWRGQAALCALDDAALEARIASVVDGELDRLADEAPQRLPPGLRALERERLCRLLRGWLDLERTRPPFVVESIEGSRPEAAQAASRDEQLVHFAGLQLRLRADRVDRLADGRRLVLDYKTGSRKPLPWHDGRPEEPQLLLYGLDGAGSGGAVAGLAFARLASGAIGFDGIAAEAELAPGLKGWTDYRETRDAQDWDALMGRWRGELGSLAAEVRRGLASVTPKHPRQSCRDCSLHAVCRIHEAGLAADDEEEEVPA